jgi:hypothetical protein
MQQIGCVFLCIETGRSFDSLSVDLLCNLRAIFLKFGVIVVYISFFVIIFDAKVSLLMLISRTDIFYIYVFGRDCRFFLVIVRFRCSSGPKVIEPFMVIEVDIEVIKLDSTDTHHIIAVNGSS